MIKEYPKCLYKTRDEYKIAKDEREHQILAGDGWKDHWKDEKPKDFFGVEEAIVEVIPDEQIVEAVVETGTLEVIELNLPIPDRYVNILKGLDYTEEKLKVMNKQELIDIQGIGPAIAEQIVDYYGHSA